MTYPVLSASSSTGYQIQRSVRTRSSANGYFNRTFGTPTNASRWTKSLWIKRGALGYVPILGAQTVSAAANYAIQFNAGDTFTWQFSNALTLVTTQVFRDPSAWYHIVLVWDCTNATAANKAIIYVNGVQVTTFTTDNRASLSATQNAWETAGTGFISYNNTTNTFDGYLAEINFVDGQALTPTSFGEFNSISGVWQSKRYAGTYGTNGFYLKFTDNSAATATTIGKDFSGNNNNWTPNNISVTAGVTYDSMLDVPTLNNSTAGNFCTFNPVNVSGGGAATTITNGNLSTTAGATVTFAKVLGTFGVSTGKWYWETTIVAVGSTATVGFGDGSPPSAATGLGGAAGELSYLSTGQKYTNAVASAYGATYTTGDIIGAAYDADAGSITFYKNNVSQGAITGFSGIKYPAVGSSGGTNPQYAVNFGQRPFAYTPPTGFNRLCTSNLPSPAIPDGATNFAATLYTGTGATLSVTNTLLNASFQPNFVWIKSRSAATNHSLYDSVRGTTKQLVITTAAETTQATGLTAFNSNGFTVGALANVNTSAATYVAWNWKAGSSTVTNTAGSITSQVSANPTAGVSVVLFNASGAAATIGHGLGVAPKMIIQKYITQVAGFFIYHASIGAGNIINLNTTGAASANSTIWNNTAPTSSVYSIGSGWSIASSVIAYCFAEIAGFSSFGSYEGNNNANGPFIYTGFRPRFVVIKEYTSARGWIMFDTLRNPSNVVDNYIFAEVANAAASLNLIDILSNGFKIRSTNINVNDVAGQRFIYFAFAENPFQNALAR
jgi:hypothetical protein